MEVELLDEDIRENLEQIEAQIKEADDEKNEFTRNLKIDKVQELISSTARMLKYMELDCRTLPRSDRSKWKAKYNAHREAFGDSRQDFTSVVNTTADGKARGKSSRGFGNNKYKRLGVEETTSGLGFSQSSIDLQSQGSGLYSLTPGAAKLVPLQKIKSDVQILESVGEVTLVQQYVNNEDMEIVAKYVFPVDDQAAVCGFHAIIQGRKIEGVVKPKQEAKQEFNTAMKEGHGAYLLEQETPDVFVMNVGNIPPGVEVEISITYVTSLKLFDDTVEFTLPLAVMPRYDPNSMSSSLSHPSGSSAAVPQYTIEISILADMGSQIANVTSPSHNDDLIHTRTGETTLEICLSSAQPLDRDFVLLIKQKEPHMPISVTEYCETSNTNATCISFVPDLIEGESGRSTSVRSEMIFVVDRSGSMSGASIEDARATLLAFLEVLQEGRYADHVMFNIVGFGMRHENLFPKPVSLHTKDNREKALEYARKLQADMGGTEILSPLQDIFRTPPEQHYARQVFLLTDGGVRNTDEIVSLVRQNADSTRIFTFGIGYSVSRDLVNRVALAGGGSAEFIHASSHMKEVVLRQLKRALQPAVTELRIDWGGLNVIQSPHTLRTLFDMEPCKIYGILKEEKEGSEMTQKRYEVSLNGFLDAKPITFGVSVDFTKVRTGRAIHSLAARELIRDLSEGTSHIHSKYSERRSTRLLDELVVQEITRLGVAHNLVSKHTSFIAIEQRPNAGEIRAKPNDNPEIRDVPQYSCEQFIEYGQSIQARDDESADCIIRIIHDTCAVSAECSEGLITQTHHIRNMYDHLYEIDDTYERAHKIVCRMARRTMTDKYVWILTFLIVAAVITIIALKV